MRERTHPARTTYCGEILLAAREVEVHHKLARKDGGSNKSQNLLVLHSTCHKQVTHCRPGGPRYAKMTREGIIVKKGSKEIQNLEVLCLSRMR